MAQRRTRFEIARCSRPDLPLCLEGIVSEAVSSGHAWASQFDLARQSRPFTGEGDAVVLASNEARLLAMAPTTADPFMDDSTIGRLHLIDVRREARRKGVAHEFAANA